MMNRIRSNINSILSEIHILPSFLFCYMLLCVMFVYGIIDDAFCTLYDYLAKHQFFLQIGVGLLLIFAPLFFSYQAVGTFFLVCDASVADSCTQICQIASYILGAFLIVKTVLEVEIGGDVAPSKVAKYSYSHQGVISYSNHNDHYVPSVKSAVAEQR